MKQKIKILVAAVILSFISINSFSQDQVFTTPAWSSDKGYWVTESNIHSPLDHIIRFYTNDDILVYKETLTGVKLNITKRKVKMKLKKLLEAAVLAWEKKRESTEESGMVRAILNKP